MSGWRRAAADGSTAVSSLLRQATYGARCPTVLTSIPHNTQTKLSFSSTHFNRGGVWSASQPTRFTCPVDGLYLAFANIGLTGGPSVAGLREGFMQREGSQSRRIFDLVGQMTTDPNRYGGASVEDMVAGDYVEVYAYITTGNATAVNLEAGYGCGLVYVGPPQIVEAPMDAYRSTTPPSSPRDGQRWIFPADVTNGVDWEFVYNASSSSAYKWEFVGGPPQRSEITPTETVNTTANTWTDAPTIGPSVVVARAGEYWVRYGLGWYATLSSATVLAAGVSIGGAVPIPPNLLQYNFAVGGQYLGMPSAASLRTFAAGNTVKMIYQTSITAVPAMSIFYRWLELTPVRVS